MATLSGNSLRQTVHTHRASVHQAGKLVAALLSVAGVTIGLSARPAVLRKVMATCRRVCDSPHLQADCQEPRSAPEPYTLGNRVRATFTFFTKFGLFFSLSVGLSADLIPGTARPNFTELSKHFTRSRVSVLFCRRCDMLCTSGFVNDVIFSHNRPGKGDRCLAVWFPGRASGQIDGQTRSSQFCDKL